MGLESVGDNNYSFPYKVINGQKGVLLYFGFWAEINLCPGRCRVKIADLTAL